MMFGNYGGTLVVGRFNLSWHSEGNCWSWRRVRLTRYYSGRQIGFSWGRIWIRYERKR